MNVIYKTIPIHMDEEVGVDQVLEVFFMVDIVKNSLNEENIILFDLKEQRAIPFTHTYTRRQLKVMPKRSLNPKGHYQLQLIGGDKGVKDITGRTMADSIEVEFKTKDTGILRPPLIISPVDVSVAKEAPSIRLQPVTEARYYDVEISKSNTFQNIEWPYDGTKIHHSDHIEFIADAGYENGLYYLRVRSANHEEDKSAWSDPVRFFYDGQPDYSEPVDPEVPQEEVDEVTVLIKTQSRADGELSTLQDLLVKNDASLPVELKVTNASPKDGVTHHPVAKFNDFNGNSRKIHITFDDMIDPASIKIGSIYVLSERN